MVKVVLLIESDSLVENLRILRVLCTTYYHFSI